MWWHFRPSNIYYQTLSTVAVVRLKCIWRATPWQSWRRYTWSIVIICTRARSTWPPVCCATMPKTTLNWISSANGASDENMKCGRHNQWIVLATNQPQFQPTSSVLRIWNWNDSVNGAAWRFSHPKTNLFCHAYSVNLSSGTTMARIQLRTSRSIGSHANGQTQCECKPKHKILFIRCSSSFTVFDILESRVKQWRKWSWERHERRLGL